MLTGKTHQWVATNSTGLRELKCSSIQYQDKPYVRLNGGDWVPYRSKNEKGRRVSPLRPGPGANAITAASRPHDTLLPLVQPVQIILARMPAMTGAAKSCQKASPALRTSYSRLCCNDNVSRLS